MILNLNLFEVLAGAVFGTVPIFWIGPWVIVTIPVCAFLWAWTGAGHGAVWRKVLMPTIVVLAIFAARHHWQVFIGLPFMIGALSLGYGIPSTQPPDPGSWIGQLWWRWTAESSKPHIEPMTEKEHQDKAEFFTRATIYTILLASFIPALF